MSRSAGGTLRRHAVQHGQAVQGRLVALPAWVGPAVVAVGALTWCTAVGVANPTQPGNLLPHCPFKTLTGWDCPGCGSTRMIYSLMHGDVWAAAGFNVVALIMTPVLIWAWLAWTARRVRGIRLPTWQMSSRAQQTALLLWLLFTVARNLPWSPFTGLYV